jgi:hypothetical protein
MGTPTAVGDAGTATAVTQPTCSMQIGVACLQGAIGRSSDWADFPGALIGIATGAAQTGRTGCTARPRTTASARRAADNRFATAMLGCEGKLRPYQMQRHAPQLDRAALVRRVLQLERLTAGWMLIEAVVAIGSVIAARILKLAAFGLDKRHRTAISGHLAAAARVRWLVSGQPRSETAFIATVLA